MFYFHSAFDLSYVSQAIDVFLTIYAFFNAVYIIKNNKWIQKKSRDIRLLKRHKTLTADEEQRMIEKFSRGDEEAVQFVVDRFYEYIGQQEEVLLQRQDTLMLKEAIPIYISCPKTTMSSSQTVESYVSEITLKTMDAEYPYLDSVYETLQKMRSSSKQKHGENYWKVLQCLGEMASDVIVKAMVQCERGSCKCHINRNLFVLTNIFVDVLSSIAAIKHINLYKDKVVPVFFKALRQREIPELNRKAFACLYRCLLVGKFSFVEMFLRQNIFRDIHEHIKCRLAFYSIPAMEAIEYCSKILHAMAVLGGTNAQRRIKSSQALKVLMEYFKTFKPNNVQMEKSVLWCAQRDSLFVHQHALMQILFEETEENLKDTWHPKDKLIEELGDDALYFCSCPSCRKQYSEKDKFLYCGACKLSRYCSEKCQKEHWKTGHKLVCLKQRLQDKDF